MARPSRATGDELNEERSPSEALTRELPLFPLPEYTLFPNTLVPFHVYEPRFRDMLAHCVSGRRLLVVAALSPGWEHQPPERTPTVAVAGLGRVLSDRRYPDGRLDLFVHGIDRVRISTRLRTEPWPIVDVERVPDRLGDQLDGALQRLASVTARLAASLGDEGAPLRELLASTSDPAVLTNRLAATVVEDFAARQALLETTCPAERSAHLVDHIGAVLLRLEAPEGAGDGWVN